MTPNRNNMRQGKEPSCMPGLVSILFCDYSKSLLLKLLHSVSELIFFLSRKKVLREIYRFTRVTTFSDLVPSGLQPFFLIVMHVYFIIQLSEKKKNRFIL